MFHCFYVVYPDCNALYSAVLLIGLPPVYDWVRGAHIFSFLYYVVFCVLCLSSSCAQCCLFMIAPSVFCNVYLSCFVCAQIVPVSLDFPFVIAPSALLTYICICFVLQFIFLYHLWLKHITRLKIYFGISIFVMHGE